jgi:hypothetical protein
MSHALATVRHDGRRPSVTPGITCGNTREPRSGDRQSEDDGCGSRRSRNLSPFQGWGFGNAHYLGLTPQANSLSRLRR